MDTATKTGIWIIATGVIIAFLYLGRAILAPFALAVFLFLVMEGFAKVIDDASETLKRRGSRIIALLTVLLGFALFIVMMARGIAQFGSQAGQYERKINQLVADVYGSFGMETAPTLMSFFEGEGGGQVFNLISGSIGNLSENFVLILIYIAFLYIARPTWEKKFDAIFNKPERREQVRIVGDDARRGIQTYLWTQTVISVLITVLTYGTLVILGVQNALFLAGMIFVLNYIPTIGSIIAAFVPLLFALVQPSWPAYMPDNSYINAAIVFGAVSFWQFSIGNFIQPRMMGESLNLSALVVLLALAIWGAIWGIPGMFLSAPLTVLMMIGFAQSENTRWIAILLSADGNPEAGHQTKSVVESPETEVEV